MTVTTATKVPASHSGKVTAASRAYTKGLQAPAARDGYFKDGKGFAVDVKRSKGSNAYQAGVITRFYNTRAEAEAFASDVNSGKLRSGWYATATHATVVPAYNVPVGKSAVDVLKAAAKPRKQPTAKQVAAAASAAGVELTPALQQAGA